MRTLAPALALALLAVAPVASAATALVHLEERGELWNGASQILGQGIPVQDEVRVWVPAGARIHAVEAANESEPVRVSWEALRSDVLLVRPASTATSVTVTFDVADRRPHAFVYRGGLDVSIHQIVIVPDEGRVPESDDREFQEVAPGTFATVWAPVQGETEGALAIRVIDAGRVGELPLLLTVGGLSILVLVGTLVWHRVRPPLEGREPQKLLDHLGELQARILPPVLVFALLNLFYFASGIRLVNGIPVPTWGVDASIAARAFEAVAERLVPPDVQLVVLRPADAVLAQVGMCLFLAFVTVLPLLVYELAAFIGPGLEARERNIAMRVLPLVTGLFLAGALLAYLVMAPLMIRTLYDYAPGIGATPLLAVGDLVSFALLVILALGAAFELPVVMYVLARLGLVRSKTFGKYVRHAILAIVVLAGLITPDPSVVSQLLLAIPVVALYVLGIGAAALGERAKVAA